jgi:hypothetical protein
MFLFGGIPSLYYERLKERAQNELREHQFTGVPLPPSGGDNFAIDERHCAELISALVAYVQQRPACLDKGLGVVLVLRPWQENRFEPLFQPFGICAAAYVDQPIKRDGLSARLTANIYVDNAFQSARQLLKPVRAFTTEFEARLRRTPLLLPRRHFASARLNDLFQQALEIVREADNPTEAIRSACSEFEKHHPYVKTGKKQGRFTNPAGANFVAPGRQIFHGRRADKVEAGHNERCFLNARVRLGGAFVDGFHYDCSRGAGRYVGAFSNCHDVVGQYAGNPHLNVYPHDFIRA